MYDCNCALCSFLPFTRTLHQALAHLHVALSPCCGAHAADLAVFGIPGTVMAGARARMACCPRHAHTHCLL